eukprot:m51a1_g11712 hypothetical protein (123) ;mRNA; f:73322-73774
MNAKLVCLVAAALVAVVVADCNSTSDLQVFHDQHDTFHKSVQDCATKCWGKAACSSTCIQQNTGLSQSCSDCFGDDCACMASKCIKQCMLNPQSEGCLKCHEESCLPALVACAAVPDGTLPQ